MARGDIEDCRHYRSLIAHPKRLCSQLFEAFFWPDCAVAVFSRSEGKTGAAFAGAARKALARANRTMAAVMVLVVAVVMEPSIG